MSDELGLQLLDDSLWVSDMRSVYVPEVGEMAHSDELWFVFPLEQVSTNFLPRSLRSAV